MMRFYLRLLSLNFDVTSLPLELSSYRLKKLNIIGNEIPGGTKLLTIWEVSLRGLSKSERKASLASAVSLFFAGWARLVDQTSASDSRFVSWSTRGRFFSFVVVIVRTVRAAIRKPSGLSFA